MIPERLVLWVVFNVFVLGMLALDLGVFHRRAHAVSLKEAGIWSAVWISLALLFNLGINFTWGQEKALEFLTGYVIEKSLSVDNLFVFLMIFQYFATPAELQHRVLFWGIIGALLLRALFIATGAALLQNFHWMIYIFGAFLVFTGIKMLLQGDAEMQPDKNPALRLFRRLMPITPHYNGQRFFVFNDGKRHATLLMVVLIVVETTDVIFAVDSIPAIFAVTQDPFIVYTSNVFAILGLRALYFLLAGVMEMFKYLKVGLSFVLGFVGTKMMIVDLYEVPVGASLGIIAAILILSMIASLSLHGKKQGDPSPIQETNHSRASAGFLANAGTGKLWAVLLLITGTLSVVKWNAITRGPSADDVIATIRIVERDFARQEQLAEEHHVPVLASAHARLAEAWSELEAKRYDNAMEMAHGAHQLLDKTYRLE